MLLRNPDQIMHEYRPCCYENATQSAYRLCPECGTRFIRCPFCGGLLSELGHCAHCVKPVVQIKTGMRLKEGALCQVPLEIGNLGAQPFTIRSLAYSVPGHAGPKALRANVRLAPGSPPHEYVDVTITLDRSGEYSLNIECELEWECGRHIGMAFVAHSVVSAATRDALIKSEGGTGNMIYVSGEASTRIVEQQLERDSSSCGYRQLTGRAMQVSELSGFGGPGGAVTLATKLELPDFYAQSKGEQEKAVELWADPREGILLGRDKPGPGSRNHACLRIPSRVTNAGELTKQVSGTHWRLFPSEGQWWLEVLGRVPTLAGAKAVQRGQPVALAENTILCPLADRPSALRLRLENVERKAGVVTKSRLVQM